MARLVVQRAIAFCPRCESSFNRAEFERLDGHPTLPIKRDGDESIYRRICSECHRGLVVVRNFDQLEERHLWQPYEDYLQAHPGGTRKPLWMPDGRLEWLVMRLANSTGWLLGLAFLAILITALGAYELVDVPTAFIMAVVLAVSMVLVRVLAYRAVS